MIDNKKILRLGDMPDDDAIDGLERAIKFLEENGAPLTEIQKIVLIFGTTVAQKNETDTWDRRVCVRRGNKIDKAVLKLFEKLGVGVYRKYEDE